MIAQEPNEYQQVEPTRSRHCEGLGGSVVPVTLLVTRPHHGGEEDARDVGLLPLQSECLLVAMEEDTSEARGQCIQEAVADGL